MLATFVHFTTLARTGRIDMPLTLTVSLTLVGFVEGIIKRRKRGGHAGWQWFLLAYLAIAAGIMLKGPVAIALPAAVGLAWWLAQKLLTLTTHHSPLTTHHSPLTTLLWGIPLVLLLALPWYLWANYRTDGEFFRVFFWHHNIDRGFGTEDHLRAYPWWFYGPHCLIDLLPWSLLLPWVGWSLWRRRDRDAGFGAVWLLGMLALLSCMRFKRADYLLPAFPGAAWMLGCIIERWFREAPSRRLMAGFVSTTAVTAVMWVGYVTMVIPLVDETRTHRRFAEEIRRRTAEPVLFFWTEAHLIAFHVGQPMTTSVNWQDLDNWAGDTKSRYVVMPAGLLSECDKHVKQGTLEPLVFSAQLGPGVDQGPGLLKLAAAVGLDNLDNREREYVLVRTHRLAPFPYTRQ